MILRCAVCDSPEVFAVKPGEEEERLAAGGFVIKRGRPDVAWCVRCWPWGKGK